MKKVTIQRHLAIYSIKLWKVRTDFEATVFFFLKNGFTFTGALLKCAAGGRDHTPCCSRRGVTSKCLSLCRGLIPQPPIDCLAYGGNIIQCFEEGTEYIPGPVENFHATLVTKSSISLEWIPNEEDTNQTVNAPKKTNDIDYVCQYGKVNNMTLYETVVKMENVNILYIYSCVLNLTIIFMCTKY